MTVKPIIVSRVDKDRIVSLLFEVENSGYRGSPYLQKLRAELRRAQVLEPHEVPSDVITMNSVATLLDLNTGETMEYTLVYPDQADVSQGKISLLAPIGTAMLGYRVGDTFEWDTPGGKRFLRVERVIFQPEAMGGDQ